MPVLDTQSWLAASVHSVLSQSYRAIELIVVDDGSTDGSREYVEQVARSDDRVRLIVQEHAGPGVARNVAIERSAGTYLSFVDSDDLMRPGALHHLVRTLERSGSDFVSGSFRRGPEHAARTPAWMRSTHARRRSRATLEDHPRMLLDITPCNKVFRRSFWMAAGLRFPEERRYEDQLPMTRALLVSRAFDVTPRDIYLWRTREQLSSITQQKGTITDLRDRIRSQRSTLALVEQLGPPTVVHTWYVKVLGFDLPGYVESALDSDGDYWRLLSDRLDELWSAAPAGATAAVALYPRVLSWLVAHRDREAAEALFEFNRTHPRGWPLEVDGGQVRARPRLETGRAVDLPEELLEVQDVDVEPRLVISAVHVGADRVVIEGFGFLTYADRRLGRTRVECELVDRVSAARLDLVTEMTQADLTSVEIEARDHEDHGDGHFRAEATLGALHGSAGTSTDWEIGATISCGRFRRTIDRPVVRPWSPATFHEPVRAGDLVLRLVGDRRSGLRIRVRSSWALLTGHREVSDGSVALEVSTPPDQRVVSAVLRRHGEHDVGLTIDPPSAHRAGTSVRLRPERSEDRSATGAELWVTLGAGGPTRVLWALDAPAVDLGGSSLWPSREMGCVVAPAAPIVSVGSVALDTRRRTPVLSLTGRSSAAGRLVLEHGHGPDGPRVEIGPGELTASLALEADPWGLGPSPLPGGSFPVTFTGADGVPHPVRATAGLRRAGGMVQEQWEVHADRAGELVVTHHPRGGARTRRAQATLRDGVYRSARAGAPQESALFECFSGRVTGDSPGAISAELVRRRTGLDIVWSVHDRAVPVPAGTRAVLRETAEWFELLGRSRLLVSNNTLPPYFAKSPDQMHVQTWHGTPLKRIGHDVARFADPLYLRSLDREASHWDVLLSPSPYCSQILPRALSYAGEVLELGHPRNDALLAVGAEQRRRRIRENLGLRDDERVVLYAPTWREDRRSGSEYAKVLFLDADRLTRRSPETVVLVRGHANVSRDTSNPVGGRVRDVTLYPDVNDLMLASDALVTDYSSLMFDYVLLDRPIVVLAPDLEVYRDRLRGLYFDIESDSPGPVVTTTDDVLAALDDDDDGWAPMRARYRERFAPRDDGAAASRVVDRLLEALGELRGRGGTPST